jgi:hypothetical protein
MKKLKLLHILGFSSIASLILALIAFAIAALWNFDIESPVLDIFGYSFLTSIVTGGTWCFLFAYEELKKNNP